MSKSFAAIPLSARYMAMSALGFALMAVFVKLSSQSGIPVLEIVAARALVSLGLSYADVRRKGISIWGHKKALLLARGGVGAIALCCVYYALSKLPLAEATLLQYLHPMFTAILAFFFLKESFQLSTSICVLLSLFGLVLIAQPEFLFAGAAIHYDSMALVAAILGAFGSGVAYVLVRKLSATEDSSVIIFYFPLIALPLSLVLLQDSFVMPSLEALIYLLLVGVFTQVGQVGLTKAMQTESAGKSTAYSYLQVLFAVVFGWVIFSEIPSFWTVVGGGFIILGALVNLLLKR